MTADHLPPADGAEMDKGEFQDTTEGASLGL